VEPVRDLARKRPAQIVNTRVINLRTEVQEGRDRWALLSDVAAQERRGYVRRLSQTPVWNFTMGVWEMRVQRLKQPAAPAVQVAKVTAAVFVPLAVFVGAIWWFLLALSTTALIGLCLVAFLLLVAVVKIHGRGSITVEQYQKVVIRK
jgi:hypothetical protein